MSKPKPKEDILIYGGQVRLRFNGKTHRYTIVDPATGSDEPFICPSVTQVLKTINPGEGLLQWAANAARDFFLSVMTPGVPLDEVEILRVADQMRYAHRTIKQKAGVVGTLVHEWVSEYIKAWARDEHAFISLPVNEDVRNRCQRTIALLEEREFRPEHSEKLVYSRKYRYAGTLDATSGLAAVGGRKAIVDFKNSKSIYPEYRFQTAAYENALEEENQEESGSYDRWVFRFGEDETEVLQLPNSEYERDLLAFTSMIPTFWRLDELRKQQKENNAKS